MSIKEIFKRIFSNNNSKQKKSEIGKLFDYLIKITKQPDAIENFSEEFYKINKSSKKDNGEALIKLYITWEEFIVNNQPIEQNKHINKTSFRKTVSGIIDINGLEKDFKLLFLSQREQELQLYENFVNYLSLYVITNLGYASFEQTIKDSVENTIFEDTSIDTKGVVFEELNTLLETKKGDYPMNTIVRSFKGLISTLYNKIDLSLGEKITQGIFSKFFQDLRSTYSSEIATILIKVTPERVLSLEDWLSILSKTELEKQVKDKTIELESLNESLEFKVTERTKDLEKAYDELKELDKKKSEFISIAAHQLRTPLNGIKWTLNMLQNEELGALNEEQKSFLTKTYSTNERILSIVNDMLDTDLIITGKEIYNFSKTDIFEILNDVIFKITPNANEKNVKIEKPAYDKSSALIIADPKKLELVFENLIENSIKYSPENSTVNISVSKEGEFIKTEIKDAGIGIPEKEKNDIFKRFFRADNAIRRQVNGSGLGLFIAKNVVEKHGGKIWFNSIEGQGSTFIFTIPLNRKMEA